MCCYISTATHCSPFDTVLCCLVEATAATSHASNGCVYDEDSDSDEESDDDSYDEEDDDDGGLLQHYIHTKHDRLLRHDGLNNNISRKILTPEVSS